MFINKTVFFLTLLCFCYHGQSQQSINVKLKIKLNSSDDFQHQLSNCSVIIYENSSQIDSLFIKGHTFKYELTNRSLYKVIFKKNDFVSKHVIVNTTNYPEKKIKKFKLKADLGLFRKRSSLEISFLERQPVSIAYFNEIKKEMMWDFEYNRSIVEKIIHAQIQR